MAYRTAIDVICVRLSSMLSTGRYGLKILSNRGSLIYALGHEWIFFQSSFVPIWLLLQNLDPFEYHFIEFVDKV